MIDLVVLATDVGVREDVIAAAGWVLGVGGVLLAALWLHYVYR